MCFTNYFNDLKVNVFIFGCGESCGNQDRAQGINSSSSQGSSFWTETAVSMKSRGISRTGSDMRS